MAASEAAGRRGSPSSATSRRHFSSAFVHWPRATASVAVGVVVGADRQLDHGLPEKAPAAAQALPHLFPGIVRGKVIGGAKMRQAGAQAGDVMDQQGHGGPSKARRLTSEVQAHHSTRARGAGNGGPALRRGSLW